jgi:hypothetical protein
MGWYDDAGPRGVPERDALHTEVDEFWMLETIVQQGPFDECGRCEA